VLQYITSLTQNAAVKPGTIFISRPLVSATEDGGKGADLFTNGTELTVSNDPVSVVVATDDEQLQVVAFLTVDVHFVSCELGMLTRLARM